MPSINLNIPEKKNCSKSYSNEKLIKKLKKDLNPIEKHIHNENIYKENYNRPIETEEENKVKKDDVIQEIHLIKKEDNYINVNTKMEENTFSIERFKNIFMGITKYPGVALTPEDIRFFIMR